MTRTADLYHRLLFTYYKFKSFYVRWVEGRGFIVREGQNIKNALEPFGREHVTVEGGLNLSL